MEQFGPLQIVGTILLAGIALLAIRYFGSRLMRQLPPMIPLPVQTLFSYCTFFTVGVALISTTASLLVPFGIVFVVLGLSIFLPERVALRFYGVFLLLLGLSLLHLLKQLQAGAPLVEPHLTLSIWSAGAAVFFWGIGILFAWRRWDSSRTEGRHDA